MKNFNPLVSIVIPVFNGSNYMRAAIDSALAQTYPKIEIIVINDGSSDDGATDSIAMSYGNRIRYFKKENGGCASALNLGIFNMEGEYFSWLSHDDVYYPDKVAHQIDILSSLDDKDTILYGGWDLIDAKSKRIGQVNPHDAQPVDKLNISLFPLLRGLLHGCSMLVPVRYFKELGRFNENLPSTQDYDLWFRFLRVAPIHYDAKILIQSRVHPDQGTHKITKHIEECNQLWCGFLAELSQAEMCALEETPYRFLKATSKFLSNTPYQQAKKLADRMSGEEISNALVSIVMPFHNRIDWVIEALESVRNQTHSNLEIILVDDGSNEPTRELENIIEQDARVKLIRIAKSGPARARNIGVSVANGIYLAFLDSDDCFKREKISRQLSYLEDGGFAIGHTSYQRMDLTGNDLGIVHSGSFSGEVFPKIINNCPIATPTVMGLSKVFRDNPFPESISLGEDVSLWIKITEKHLLGGLDVPLTLVRVGPSTASSDLRKQIVGRLNIATFVASDIHLSKYGRELRESLRVTSMLIPDLKNSQVKLVPVAWYDDYKALGLAFISYARRNGLLAALKRARFVFRSKRLKN